MNDKILEIQLWNFGIIVRRKTLAKGFAFVLAVFLFIAMWQYNQNASKVLDTVEPNLDLTWARFSKECGGGENQYKSRYNFEQMWQGKVVKWEGIVLRVDAYDPQEDNSLKDVWIGEQQHRKHAL